MKGEVSILIPTFNRGYLIERAIESSLNQSYRCNVIVCDHGSIDNTKEICKEHKQARDRVIVMEELRKSLNEQEGVTWEYHHNP